MDWEFDVFRYKRTDWMITWHENKVRWILFYYILGLIFSCLIMFIEETLYPLPLRYLYKSLAVTVGIPCLTVAMSILVQSWQATNTAPAPGNNEEEPPPF